MAFGKLFVDLALRDEKFKASLKSAGGSVKGFEKGVLGLDKAISQTFVTGLKVATAAVVAFGAASAKVGTDFQHSITLVKTLSKDGISNFKALEDEARRLGATTEFSARQSADAMINFARAGMDAREIIAATGPALMMAGGAGESMSLATMAMAASLRQFSLDAAESGHVADVFTVALKRSLFNLQGLNDAMKYAGPAGAVFGMSIEETTAAVAQFRNMGLDASMAGTAFRMSMVALAKQTPAMTKVMKKYGLTTDEVSVTNIGFASVLDNLAEKGVTAEDAIKMFGARAGANMGLLIQQMQKPEIKQGFKDLTADLYKSSQGAGAAKEQYDEMGKTVKRQFLIAKSAAEELMITVFDTFSADLMKFLRALGGVIQTTADTFNGLMVSGTGLNSMLQDATSWLKENEVAIAAMFVTAFEGVQKVLGYINALIPAAKVLAQIFLHMFPVLALRAFATTLATIPALLKAVASGASAMGVSVTASLGPIAAAAAAVGVYVLALSKLSDVIEDTEGKAARFQAQLKKFADDEADGAKKTSKVTAASLKAQKENLEVHAKWMKAQGQSEAAVERYRQRLEALTGETVTQQVAAGTLIEIQKDGVTEYHNVLTAAAMLGEEGIAPLETKLKSLKDGTETQSQQYETLKAQINMVKGVEDDYTKVLTTRGMTREHLLKVMGASSETLADWQGQLVVAGKRLKMISSETGNATKALNQYRLAILNTGGADLGFGPPAAGGAPKSKGTDPRKAMREKLAKLEQKLQDDLTEIGLDGDETRSFNLEKQLRAVAKQYDELIAKERSRRKKADLEARKAAAEVLVNQIHAAKVLEEKKVEADKRDQERMKAHAAWMEQHQALLTQKEFGAEADALQKMNKIRFDAEKYGVALSLIEQRRIERTYRAERLAGAVKDATDRAAAEGRAYLTADERKHIQVVQNENRLAEKITQIWERYEQESRALKLRSAKLSGEELAAEQQKLNGKLINRLNKAEKAKILRQKAADTAELVLTKLKLAKARDLIVKFAKSDVPVHVSLLEKATGLSPEKQKEYGAKLKKAAEGFDKFFIKPVIAATKKAIGIFKEMTGFSWDFGGMMGEAAGKKEEMGQAAVDAAVARRGGESMTAEEEAAVRAKGEAAFDPKKAAEEVAEEKAAAMLAEIQGWIDMMPTLVAKLAEELPVIIDKFVEAVPIVIKAVNKSLKGPDGLIHVLIKGIPLIVKAMMKSLPGLINTLVNGLIWFIRKGIPDILGAILMELPAIVMGIADAIPLLFEAIFIMIPKVLEHVFNMLPELLAALVKLVLNLLALLYALIPKLLTAVINMIGPLVLAVVQSIPVIISAVIDAIPQIVTAIIGSIAELIIAIVMAVPQIIVAVVAGLPLIIVGIIKLIPKLLKAIFYDMPKMLAASIGEGFGRAWRRMKRSIANFFASLNPFKKKDGKKRKSFKESNWNPKNWFKDTPGPLRIKNPEGAMMGFSPNDYVIAAQKPIDALAQALDAVSRDTAGGIPRRLMSRDRKRLASMMASPVPMGAAMGDARTGGGGAQMNLAMKVQVEGQTIDRALITAKDRGTSPEIWREIRRLTGVTTGFDRE